jgi:hypothetical protein
MTITNTRSGDKQNRVHLMRFIINRYTEGKYKRVSEYRTYTRGSTGLNKAKLEIARLCRGITMVG